MRTKRLPDEETLRARAFVARIVKDDFAGNVSEAARTIGLSQSGLAEFLAGNRGAGLNVLRPIARYAKVGVDVVMGLADPPAPPLNQHRDWPKARAEAERQHPEIPAEFLDLVGRGHLPGEPLETIDAALIAGLAREWAAAAARIAARRRAGA